MNSQQTMYFYKGTVFPITAKEFGDEIGEYHKNIVKASIDIITTNLKKGISKKELINDSIKQLDIIEQHMCDIEEEMGFASEKSLKELCKRYGIDQDVIAQGVIMDFWAININILLMLKGLKQDNENGILCVQTLTNEGKKKKAEENSKTYNKGCGEFHIDLNKSWE